MGRPPYKGRFHYFIGSKTRASIIERLIKHPEHEPYLRELACALNAGMGALHRELTELKRIGLVSSSARGGARYYKLDPEHPLARPFFELVTVCDALDAQQQPQHRPQHDPQWVHRGPRTLTRGAAPSIVDRRLTIEGRSTSVRSTRGGCLPMSPQRRVESVDPERLALVGRALSHPARIRILQLLAVQSECRGAEVFAELPLAQSTISEHLRILREAGIVTSHPVGTAMTYCLTRGAVDEFLDAVDALTTGPECIPDVEGC